YRYHSSHAVSLLSSCVQPTLHQSQYRRQPERGCRPEGKESWRNIAIPPITGVWMGSCQVSGEVVGVNAFDEKAGRSQVDSLLFLKKRFSPRGVPTPMRSRWE